MPIQLKPNQILELPDNDFLSYLHQSTTYTPLQELHPIRQAPPDQPLPTVRIQDLASKDWIERNKPVNEFETVMGLAQTVDWLTGAPVRAALGEALKPGDNPLSALKAGITQFGRHPSTAPTGSQLAEQMGVTTRQLKDFVPGMAGGWLSKQKISDIAGAGIEAGADLTGPMMAMGGLAKVGEKASEIGEWLGNIKKRAGDGEIKILRHDGQGNKSFEIDSKKGQFGGIFAGPEGGGLYSDSEYLVAVPENKIMTHYDFKNELDYGDYEKSVKKNHGNSDNMDENDIEELWDYVAEDKNVYDLSPDDLERLTGETDAGQASWDIQKLRGQIAKDAGYDAVEMIDETGTSTLVLKGKAMKVPSGKSYREFEDIIYDEIKKK